jgi:hypothetical protein
MKTKEIIKQKTEMGTIILSKNMLRLREDEKIETFTIEIDTPEEHEISEKGKLWTCNLKISGINRIITCSGLSSLDAVASAMYMSAEVIKKSPFATELDMGLLPNFGLPINPLSDLSVLTEEQERSAIMKERMRISITKE